MWSEKNDFSLSINQSDEITQGAMTIFLTANKLTCTEMEDKSHVPQCAILIRLEMGYLQRGNEWKEIAVMRRGLWDDKGIVRSGGKLLGVR